MPSTVDRRYCFPGALARPRPEPVLRQWISITSSLFSSRLSPFFTMTYRHICSRSSAGNLIRGLCSCSSVRCLTVLPSHFARPGVSGATGSSGSVSLLFLGTTLGGVRSAAVCVCCRGGAGWSSHVVSDTGALERLSMACRTPWIAPAIVSRIWGFIHGRERRCRRLMAWGWDHVHCARMAYLHEALLATTRLGCCLRGCGLVW